MTCATAATSLASPCPCGEPEFPVVICNPANQPAILYRAGSYLDFRNKLLHALPGETQLTAWQPGATGDLAVQMIEWWAYLADILTFYNERIANETYLGTAILPASVNHLVQLLGYRPRPALGAKVQLAGLLGSNARLPVALPKGLQVQSKPGPGSPPQIFELDQASTLGAPDLIAAQIIPSNANLLASPGAKASGDSNSIWLAGKVTSIKNGESLLLINSLALANPPSLTDYAWINITGTQPTTDPLGNSVTAVSFTLLFSNLSSTAQAASYALLRGAQSSPLWSFNSTGISGDTITLAGLVRSLTPNALFLLDIAGASSPAPTALLVASYAEAFWYANGDGATAPQPVAPSTTPPAAIGIPVSQITVAALDSAWASAATASITLRYGFTAAGSLAPVLAASDYAYPQPPDNALTPLNAATGFPDQTASVLLEDVNGAATAATLTANAAITPNALASPAATTNSVTLTPVPAQPGLALASPIDVLFNLLPFSRGKTVPMEVLGSGNPSVAGQDFTLQNSPVTYFAGPASVSGNGFSSTVQVSVNNVLWQEVQSFYGQGRNAQVFVLREDDAGQTHVTFGDGVNGALLPTGTNNVVASYRYGAGASAPAKETLTVVQTPQPGLKSIRNPLQPTGGNDADDPARLRSLAPQSVLTFNRAVSLDDYAAIALTGAGVTQVATGYVFDPLSQRPKVTLWVAGDAGAAAAATGALAGITLPGQGLQINPAIPVNINLSLNFLCDSPLDAPAIQTALTTALTDPDAGLFGANVIGIGQVIYDSQIEAACLGVAGVQAVHDLSFAEAEPGGWHLHYGVFRRPFGPLKLAGGCAGNRHDPGQGRYFVIASLSANPVTPVTA